MTQPVSTPPPSSVTTTDSHPSPQDNITTTTTSPTQMNTTPTTTTTTTTISTESPQATTTPVVVSPQQVMSSQKSSTTMVVDHHSYQISKIYSTHICLTDRRSSSSDAEIQFGAISWSQKNMICLAAHNTLQHNHSHLLLIDPNVPGQYTKIHTDHSLPATALDWGLVSCSNPLLSVDDQDTVCFWKCKDHCVNDYGSYAKFNFEGVLCARFIHSERRRLELLSFDAPRKFNEGIRMARAVPTGAKAFLCVCKTGQVHFCMLDLEKQKWVTSSIHLNVEEIAVADFTIRHDGTILIACVASNNFAVHIFHCSLTKTHLTSDVKPYTPRTQLNLEEHTIFTLPTSPSLLVNGCDSGITKLKFIPFIKDEPELLIMCNNNQIQKWRCVSTTVHISSVLCAVSTSQDGLPLQKTADTPPANPVVPRERPVWTQSSKIEVGDDIHITAFECTDDGSCFYLGLSNGYVRRYSLSNMEMVADIGLKPRNYSRDDEPPTKMSKIETSFNIRNIAISPNNTCFAAIDQSNNMHVCSIYETIGTEFNPRTIIQKLEISLYNSFDAWDVFVIMHKHLTTAQIEKVAQVFDARKKKFPFPPHLTAVTERWGTITYSLGGNRYLSSQLLLQAQIIVRNIFTQMRSLLADQKSEDASSRSKYLLSKMKSDSKTTKNCLLLIPLFNWLYDFCVALYKDLDDYEKERHVGHYPHCSINFLKREQLMGAIRDILQQSTYIHNLFHDPEVQASLPETRTKITPSITVEELKIIFAFIGEFTKRSMSIMNDVKHGATDINTKFKAHISELLKNHSAMNNVMPQYDRQQLMDRLDLIPQLTGVLSGNFVPNVSTRHRFDIVSGMELSKDDSAYRVCRTCSRIVSLHPKGWASRWSTACLMCASSYSLPGCNTNL